MAAGPVFTVAYLLEGASRVDYQPFRHPVSSLSLGRAGWAQTVNFLLTGLLSLIFAVGLWHVGPSHWGALASNESIGPRGTSLLAPISDLGCSS